MLVITENNKNILTRIMKPVGKKTLKYKSEYDGNAAREK